MAKEEKINGLKKYPLVNWRREEESSEDSAAWP